MGSFNEIDKKLIRLNDFACMFMYKSLTNIAVLGWYGFHQCLLSECRYNIDKKVPSHIGSLR